MEGRGIPINLFLLEKCLQRLYTLYICFIMLKYGNSIQLCHSKSKLTQGVNYLIMIIKKQVLRVIKTHSKHQYTWWHTISINYRHQQWEATIQQIHRVLLRFLQEDKILFFSCKKYNKQKMKNQYQKCL